MERSIVEPHTCVVASPLPTLCLGSDTVCKIETPLVNVWMAMLHVSNRAWRALPRRLLKDMAEKAPAIDDQGKLAERDW